jgi:hypothetical protein
MTLAQLDVTGVVDALRSMALPDGLTACELLIDFDDTTERVIAHVALILKQDSWNEDAVKACEAARAKTWDALEPFDVVPNLLCRTRAEHAAFKETEPQWIPVTDVDC